ncbi:MAG: TerB family tellurite resistance protein [Phycisphaerae bacterium]|nr:TerB family tellurite resistance protein [Phycisphaerae bacterium]
MTDVDRAHENLKNVMVLALADGQLSEEEKRYIERLRSKLGVDAKQFTKLVDDVKRDRNHVSVPQDREAAEQTGRLLVEAASSDGRIDELERDILHRLAKRVGLSGEDVDTLVRQVEPTEEEAAAMEEIVRDLYAHFTEWDEPQRKEAFDKLAGFGKLAVMPLLRMLESYRRPDGADDAIELKVRIARTLGDLGDTRPVFYLAQQAAFGDVDDEISNARLRQAAAEALGKLVGEDFSADEQGVLAAGKWWRSPEHEKYDKLVF